MNQDRLTTARKTAEKEFGADFSNKHPEVAEAIARDIGGFGSFESLMPIPAGRRGTLNGNWMGTIENVFVTYDPPPPFTATIACRFTVGRTIIVGDGRFEREGTPHHVTFLGHFNDKSYIRMAYEHDEPLIAYGYMILFLDDFGNSLSGKSVLYGGRKENRPGTIIFGRIELKKQPQA